MPKATPCCYCGDPTWSDEASHPRCRPIRHGTETGYSKGGCRCDLCKAANAERMRVYVAMVKARDGVDPTTKYRRANGRTPQTYARACVRCGVDFTTHRNAARFCSISCGVRDKAGWSTSTALVVYEPPPVPMPKPPRPPRRTEWWAVVVQGPCRRCGTQFTALNAAGVPYPTAYCSMACTRADASDRRRAAKRNAYVADVSPRKIFERDRWVCQICGWATARGRKVPHPKAPTVDHIIPLAAGGTHEPTNAQCAHFLCNAIKGARSANDQLRLIG